MSKSIAAHALSAVLASVILGALSSSRPPFTILF